MKNIIVILLTSAVTLMAQDVKVELQNSLRKLKNCYLRTGEDAMDLALSENGIEYHKNYSGAVYYSCDNGYFTYIQDRIKGDFIRGEICKNTTTVIPLYSYCLSDSKSEIRFQLSILTFNRTCSVWFDETDENGMRINDIDIENTEGYCKKLMIDVYRNFSSKRTTK